MKALGIGYFTWPTCVGGVAVYAMIHRVYSRVVQYMSDKLIFGFMSLYTSRHCSFCLFVHNAYISLHSHINCQ